MPCNILIRINLFALQQGKRQKELAGHYYGRLFLFAVPHFDAVAFAGGRTSDSKMSR